MKPTSEELAKINSLLPGTKMAADDVEILPFRVFDNRVTDRFTMMTPEMMKKMMKDLEEGHAAFNKLHESRYALPVGRSVSARISTDGNNQELQAKMYAVVRRPDGTVFEDGKDLADRYNTGAVFACSAGVYVGFYKCSICGNDIRDYRNCEHYPGQQYKIDETRTETCIAYMTGKDIQDGMAMDCGIYEVSAVTAGGVRRASVLTETFGKYDKTGGSVEDLKEFKRTSFEDLKGMDERFIITPLKAEQYTRNEEAPMAGELNAQELLSKNYELIGEKAKAEANLAQAEANLTQANTRYGTLETAHGTLKEQYTKATEDLAAATAKVEEFSKQVTTLTTERDDYAAKLEEAKTTITGLEQFKAAFIAVVKAEGVKINRDADYASKSIEEIQTLYTEYLEEVAKIPSGQHTLTDEETKDEGAAALGAYASIPDSFFKAS